MEEEDREEMNGGVLIEDIADIGDKEKEAGSYRLLEMMDRIASSHRANDAVDMAEE